MKRSRKTNRVSWAPGVDLCQVKLFLKEDFPSEVGVEHQDTLQANTSRALHPSGMCASDLPPGFEGGHYVGSFKCNLAKIPRIQWRIPPKFSLDFNWHVVAGEESKEVEAQKLREKRVLEAIYPRLSVIPPKYVPPVSPNVEVECYDDSRISLVPLTPIEDDEGADVSSCIAAQAKPASNFETLALLMPPRLSNSGTPNMPHCPASATEAPKPGVSSGMMEAALVALTTVMKSKEQGSLVDTDLLVKILGDPKMVDKLIHNHGHPSVAADGNVVNAPSFVSQPETGLSSLPCSKPATISSQMPADRNSNHLVKEFQPALSMPVSRADIVSNSMPMRVESSSFPLPGTNVSMISGYGAANGTTAAYTTSNQVQPALSMMPMPMPMQPAITTTTAMQTMAENTVKDANYFKNLIREHGRQKEEAKAYNIPQTGSHLNHIQILKPGALKTKFQTPCKFYNKSNGCRQGSNCPFMHVNNSLHWQTGGTLEASGAKRMKLSEEFSGRI
ncbi:zinc finger CCCH domain-containing protein 30-like isoform X2 [Hibiscus syriacus]|uniref:zinc finger CCCH domain-containing protein 30-like isoform X2 n=1 Tax=Hibiscus syriacus TaxID=106335 RepID=UPI001923AC94|nr:zinc finger CCCH domain-containing protein 30-like isoform X2 [Hibiscus syriacus]